jgi:hypothetical protein
MCSMCVGLVHAWRLCELLQHTSCSSAICILRSAGIPPLAAVLLLRQVLGYILTFAAPAALGSQPT